MKKIRVNLVSESEISVQGHGVHTAYEEMAHMLRQRPDVELITNHFGEAVPCDIIHIHTVGPRTYKKLLQKGPKKVISAHLLPESFLGSLLFARGWYPAAKAYLRWFYNRADLLLAVSDETARGLRKMGVKAPIEVVYNSIDTSRYKKPTKTRAAVRKELGLKNDDFVVIGAGQVQPRKRVDDFIAAAKKLPDVHFIWVGGMPFGKVAADSRKMQSMMDRAPANAHFVGIKPLADMVNYYHAADLFWLPSDQETFGLVVVEAAASGLPIMLRDIPDYDETFGIDAVKGKSVDDFVQNIQDLSRRGKEYDNWKLGAKLIADRYDSKRVGEQIVRLYRDLL